MLAQDLEGRIRRAGPGYVRDGVRPFEKGALTLVIDGRLSPDAHEVDPLFAQSVVARFLRVHVDAIGASVDLRGAQLDEVDKALLKSGILNVLLEGGDGLVG